MTIGYFAPLPPARTGVADYAALLLRALRRRATVRVNAAEADVCLYHLGNNQLHREIYFQALSRPGLAVLHDAVLHHLLLGCLSEREYRDEFVYNYGEWHRDLAAELWRGRARSAVEARYFQYPMLRRLVERSEAVIVHNPAAAALARQAGCVAPVFEIPHLWQAPALPPRYKVEQLRQRYGLTGRHFLFAVFGHLRESKRLLAVLRAFDAVRRAQPHVALLVAGHFASTDLARAAGPWLEHPGVLRHGFAAEPDFWRLALACDACLNLRYPAAGETSGITIRLMGLGKPVLLTEGLENARFPEDACLRVPHDETEEALLAAYMQWLADAPEAGRAIGRRARAHVESEHNLERVAGLYLEAAERREGT